MLCLGIETSCDETGLALVRDGTLLRQVLSSQEDVHALFGGVVPEIASREHYRLLRPLFDSLMAHGPEHVASGDVDVVAVARGPGLLGSLLTGLSFAKGLALATGARLVGVDHLHAHLLAVGLERPLVFPAVGLLVSGGHTHLYRLESETSLELLGRTLDDAAGEAFDKVAKMLNLPYPGGRHIEALARLGQAAPGRFPKPYLDNQNLDFSFSGLKTAVSVYLAGRPNLRPRTMIDPGTQPVDPGLADLCASFSLSVAETLRIKTERALDRCRDARALIVAGGVAANGLVRETMARVASARGLALLLPSPRLCTDNAAMVAFLGERLANDGFWHTLSVEAVPRGRRVPWDYMRGARDPEGRVLCP